MNFTAREASEAPIKSEKASYKKLQFEFSPDAIRRLDALKERADAATRAEVIRDALKVYEWMIREINPDYTLEIQNEEGKPVFRIPARAIISSK
jgi:hypothetical protein